MIDMMEAVVAASRRRVDPARFIVILDTSFRADSTTVLIPINARTGTSDRFINWGDGTTTVENTADPTHTYAVDGVYKVQVYGGTTTRLGNTGTSPNAGWTQTLIQVVQWGKAVGWTNFQEAFRGCERNFLIPNEIPRVADGYAANVTSIGNIFRDASSFNQDIGAWNTAAVTVMNAVFFNASSFNQDIGAWNTAAVTVMNGAFFSASSFNQDIGAWNTAAVTNMSQMFQGASSFNQDIGAWNTAAVTNMSQMFLGASSFNQDIGGWSTAAVTNMNSMLRDASSFNQDIGAWSLRTAGVTMNQMLNSSGMSTENYSRTLIGWANYVSSNSDTPANVTLGATGRTYNNTAYVSGQTYNDAAAARAYLTGSPPTWTISDGGQV
jgi:surface protein